MIHGICQIPKTNSYVLKIEKVEGTETKMILLDITTGMKFTEK